MDTSMSAAPPLAAHFTPPRSCAPGTTAERVAVLLASPPWEVVTGGEQLDFCAWLSGLPGVLFDLHELTLGERGAVLERLANCADPARLLAQWRTARAAPPLTVEEEGAAWLL